MESVVRYASLHEDFEFLWPLHYPYICTYQKLLFNSTELLVRSWLFLHITLAMFSKFLVHRWSQGGGLNEGHSKQC
jgi:hypothetical protein